MTSPPGRDRPVLRVVRGDASPEEVAALVAILMASRPAGGEARSRVRSASDSWSDRSRLLRRPLFPGPGAWRRSVLP